MKNLMIYISPTGSFDNLRPDLTADDALPLSKVQIENSLALGWKKEDIMLVTNFEYQYGVVRAIVLKGVEFYERKPQASKINAIVKLFENGMMEDNQLYWFHDLDAYQLYPIKEPELKLGNADMGLVDYGGVSFGGTDRWNTSSIFFKPSSKDIFERIKEVMYEKRIDEEEALTLLTINYKRIKKRIKKLNSTYSFNGFNLKERYETAIKPLRVVHFHPYGTIRRLRVKIPLDFFMGNNPLHIPLITERLIKIFKFHRIR